MTNKQAIIIKLFEYTSDIISQSEMLTAIDEYCEYYIKSKKVRLPYTAANKMSQEEQKQAFIEAATPLIKYLAENHHPHTHVVVTATGAELSEGIIHTGEIMDFVTD